MKEEKTTYRNIAVAVDNSDGSARAEALAIRIARVTGGSITGVHAYTARFHRSRFNALEGHLPDRYQDEAVMEHQRTVHSVLIGRGLELISAEYMKRLQDHCREAQIPFSGMITDGKNADVIIEASGQCDLMAMGAEGLGHIGGTTGIGSNTRRMLRHGKSDLLIARGGGELRTILACIDGSPEAFRVVEKAAALTQSLGGSLRIAASFDPLLHKNVFSSLSSVLSSDAGRVFRFSEQEDLHNQVIDRSLASLYEGYLAEAVRLAATYGVFAGSSLLQGKPCPAVCSLADSMNADLIVAGRHGMHRGRYADIGSNAENIAERAETNVLIVTETVPDGGGTTTGRTAHLSEEPLPARVTWTDEAKTRLERVPVCARPMAVIAIERYALETGQDLITPEIMERARENLLV